jgi:metal-responsive CopG/Arc/MetJ family transcriptional regulator
MPTSFLNKKPIIRGSITVNKHSVSIALSNRVLAKIDKEASKQKRSRSEYIELHFEALLSTHSQLEN